jgi:phosphoglycerate kinase
MNLKSIEQYHPSSDKLSILRMDLDVPDNDNSRLKKSVDTFNYLVSNGGRVAIIGHKGRPQGEGYEEEFSLKKVYADFMSMVNPVDGIFMENFNEITNNQVMFFENLRFWPGEKTNDDSFMKDLIVRASTFVNDAPAVAHREHASVMLCKKLETYYGYSFIKEFGKLGEIYNKIQKPVLYFLGGKKEDKLKNLPKFLKVADDIFIGGKLPQFIDKSQPIDSRVYISELNTEGYDLSDNDIQKAKELINKSKTIIIVGAPGWFENEAHKKGTESVASFLMENTESTVIFAGGDTGASFKKFGVRGENIVPVSGGGATLEYLASGTLPAINC